LKIHLNFVLRTRETIRETWVILEIYIRIDLENVCCEVMDQVLWSQAVFRDGFFHMVIKLMVP
jgi:hypothetical protein